jgi:predicted membrane-bound mannosyltransferase
MSTVTKRGMAGVLAMAIVAALGAALLFESGRRKPAPLARPSASSGKSEPSASEPVSPPAAPKADNPCTRERCAPCPSGMRPETVAGECCPRCVSADQEACERGRGRYEDSTAELEVELRACTSDDDCMIASFSDACRARCPLPLNKQALGSVVTKLREAASVHCKDCAPQQFECPRIATDAAQCVAGRCEFRQQTQPAGP